MGDVKLFCLLPGQRLEQSFGVKLSRESDLDDLRDAIIAKCGGKLEGVSPSDLYLYRISTIDNSELSRLNLDENQPLLPKTTIGELFSSIPAKNDYILVANGIMLRCGLICV